MVGCEVRVEGGVVVERERRMEREERGRKGRGGGWRVMGGDKLRSLACLFILILSVLYS
jgi:hypothetical protein